VKGGKGSEGLRDYKGKDFGGQKGEERRGDIDGFLD
jgi:hypothetical protein